MTNDSRAAFEAWYVANAFDYERNPIGSRECGLQWASWLASRRAALEDAISVVNEWALAGHISDKGITCEAMDAIRALGDAEVKP